jgi:transcriptional regulator with XRE-family HTH domain
MYNYIKRFRKQRGLSQKEVTLILGLESSSMVSRWEKGAALPGTLNALRLAALYRTTVDNLYWDLRLAMADQITKRENAVIRTGMEDDA